MVIMPKHDHHKAVAQPGDTAGPQRKAGEANEPGDSQQASQHTPIANQHSDKSQEESNQAHRKTKGPKKL
jgi:hypothetical protein